MCLSRIYSLFDEPYQQQFGGSRSYSRYPYAQLTRCGTTALQLDLDCLLLKSTIRTSWVVVQKVSLLLLNLENINSYVAQGTLKNISVTYSITVMATPSF